ncbi:hypothetical protein Psi02_52970 [Planotetraspora silvatica]|uniref:Uncharacterized protein n=1 Tax=Planotetraspora silvatica TaxID=234614 RepID=A0A8J3XTX0_9ACTN|nr:hypothetical protein Psi02_52970 [Planotetraspora silvatica]
MPFAAPLPDRFGEELRREEAGIGDLPRLRVDLAHHIPVVRRSREHGEISDHRTTVLGADYCCLIDAVAHAM